MSKKSGKAGVNGRVVRRSFDLLERSRSFGQVVRESLVTKQEMVPASQRTRSVEPLPSLCKDLIMIPTLPFSWIFGVRGFITRTIFSIIGTDGVGKSSLVFNMMGWGMTRNSPALYVETESKPMLPERIRRCLHPDPEISQRMYGAITFEQCFTLKDMVGKVESWVQQLRDPKQPETYVPLDIPLVIAIDSLSKLMPPREAAGRSEYATSGKKKREWGDKEESKQQELDEGSTQEMAKMLHKWMRSMPGFINAYNVFVIVVEHQNQLVNKSGGGSFIPVAALEDSNRTKIGGNAINQNAAWQVVLTPGKSDVGAHHGDRVVLGRWCKMKVVKNSYGPTGRTTGYRINIVPQRDTPTREEPALNFDTDLPSIIKRSGVLTMSMPQAGLWNSQELGLHHADYHAVQEAFYVRQDLVDRVSRGLGLTGWSEDFKAQEISSVFVPEEVEAPEVEVPKNVAVVPVTLPPPIPAELIKKSKAQVAESKKSKAPKPTKAKVVKPKPVVAAKPVREIRPPAPVEENLFSGNFRISE